MTQHAVLPTVSSTATCVLMPSADVLPARLLGGFLRKELPPRRTSAWKDSINSVASGRAAESTAHILAMIGRTELGAIAHCGVGGSKRAPVSKSS